MGRIGKLFHSGTQFGQEVLRPASVDAIDAIKTVGLDRARAHAFLETRIEPGSLLFQKLPGKEGGRPAGQWDDEDIL
jgi:hypothetical protein